MNLIKSGINVERVTFYELERITRETKLLMQKYISIKKRKPVMLFCLANVHVKRNMTIRIDTSNILKEHEIPIYEKLLSIIITEIRNNERNKVKRCCRLEEAIFKFEETYFPNEKTWLTAVRIYDLLYIIN